MGHILHCTQPRAGGQAGLVASPCGPLGFALLAGRPRLLLAVGRPVAGRSADVGGTRAARSTAMNLQSSRGRRGGKISLSRTLSRSQVERGGREEGEGGSACGV